MIFVSFCARVLARRERERERDSLNSSKEKEKIEEALFSRIDLMFVQSTIKSNSQIFSFYSNDNFNLTEQYDIHVLRFAKKFFFSKTFIRFILTRCFF